MSPYPRFFDISDATPRPVPSRRGYMVPRMKNAFLQYGLGSKTYIQESVAEAGLYIANMPLRSVTGISLKFATIENKAFIITPDLSSHRLESTPLRSISSLNRGKSSSDFTKRFDPMQFYTK